MQEFTQRKTERLADISGLLLEEMAITLDDVSKRANSDISKMVHLARKFIAKPWGFLTLWGGVGNGKTLILMAIVNEMRERHNLVCAYVRFKDLIDHIRAGMDDGFSGDRKRYEYLKSVNVLAIDEMDKARMTDYAYEFRTAFLDDRYRLGVAHRAHTVFAMNSHPKDLSDDIYDRLRDGRFAIFHNRDSSMRPAMK